MIKKPEFSMAVILLDGTFFVFLCLTNKLIFLNMRIVKDIALLTIAGWLLFFPISATAKPAEQNPMTEAIKLFDKGNFKEAEVILESILEQNPDDFMACYFYGASRTENGYYTQTDLEYLEKAGTVVSPIHLNYYLGIQHHARSEWETAIRYYNRYRVLADQSDDDKYEVSEKIQQCFDKVNPFEADGIFFAEGESESQIQLTNDSIITPDTLILESPVVPTLEDETTPVKSIENQETKETLPIAEESQIDFYVMEGMTYTAVGHFKTELGKELFIKSEVKQKELQHAIQKTEQLRTSYAGSNNLEVREKIGAEILTYENRAYVLKKEITELLNESKFHENEYWSSATVQEKTDFINLLSSQSVKEPVTDTIQTQDLIDPLVLIGKSPVETPIAEPDHEDLIYKIQIGAYSRGLPTYVKRLFDKLSLIRKIENYTDDRGVVVYTTGNLTSLEDAVQMRNQIRQEGVEDAYVVPYFKGKRITLEEAKEYSNSK